MVNYHLLRRNMVGEKLLNNFDNRSHKHKVLKKQKRTHDYISTHTLQRDLKAINICVDLRKTLISETNLEKRLQFAT